MSMTDKGVLTKFLTGGDLMFHRLQLLYANFVRLLLGGVVTFVASGWLLVYFYVSPYPWYVFYKTMEARLCVFMNLPNYHLDYLTQGGRLVDGATSAAIIKYVTETPERAGGGLPGHLVFDAGGLSGNHGCDRTHRVLHPSRSCRPVG